MSTSRESRAWPPTPPRVRLADRRTLLAERASTRRVPPPRVEQVDPARRRALLDQRADERRRTIELTADERQQFRAAMRAGVDGDTIVIQLLIAIAGFGDKGDVLQLVQTPFVDNMLAAEWVVIYTGPIEPTPIWRNLSTGPMTLSAEELANIYAYLDLASVGGLQTIITPESRGAPADNIGDDTPATQAAIDACHDRGGGVVLCTSPYYRWGKLKLYSGVVLTTLAGLQLGTGAGFVCSVRPPAGFGGGFMVDGALVQTVVLSGSPSGGTYPLTGGMGGSATATIDVADSIATIQTKIRAALPGMTGAVITGIPSDYKIVLGDDVGNIAYAGAIAPGKFATSSAGLTGGTAPAVTVKRITVEGAGCNGFSFFGGMLSGSDPGVGAVRMRLSTKFRAAGISGNATTLGQVVVGGGAATISGVNCQNWAFAPPTQPTGAVTTYGADHEIFPREVSGIVSPTVPLVDAVNYYHCALAVLSTTTTVMGGIAEFGDCNIYAAGTFGRYISTRSDMSGGHGIYEPAYAYGNQFTDTLLLSPSTAADNTYDGMNLNGIGHKVDGVVIGVAVNSTSTARCRYVVYDNDISASNIAVYRNFPSTFRAIGGDVNAWQSGKFFSTLGRPCEEPDGGNPTGRPAARLCRGRTFRDTVAGRTTISDGTYWRDIGSDEIVGNLLPDSGTAFRTGIDWQGISGTVTGAVTRLSGHADFGMPYKGRAVLSAAGVAAGFLYIANTAAGTRFPVKPGETYTGVVKANPVGRTGGTVSFLITWVNAAGAPISTTAGTAPVVVSTTTDSKATIAPVAPFNAVTGIVGTKYAWAGMTVGDLLDFNMPTVVAGTTATGPEAV